MQRLPLIGMFAMLELLALPDARAQEPPVLVPGTRARITESGERSARRGTIVTSGPDTVTMRLDWSEKTIALSRAAITRVEVSQGLHGHTAAGIGIGFLAGFGVGAVVGYNSCGSCGGEEGPALDALAWGGILGAAGMLVGGVVGAHYKTDRWEEVPPTRWRLGAVPARGGVAIALSRSW